jgi:serine O-acetyltransferase
VAVFRIASWFKKHRVPFFPNFLQQYIFAVYGLEIPSGGDIKGGLYIPHPVGTVIMPARIGKNCSIIANVTIGMRNEWEFPDIGDNVFIGAGARVLGGIRIGNDAVIGANAVVVQSIPDGATAVGIPARVTRIYGKQVEG